MAWVTCSSCGLKHSARADGVCPRCKTVVDGGDAPAQATSGPPDVYDGRPPAAYAPARARVAPQPSGSSSTVTKILLGLAAAGLLILIFGAIAVRSLLGPNPLTRLALSTQIEGEPVTSVQGQAFRYRISTSAPKWYRRKPMLAKRDNPLADVWLIQPNQDAHVMVIAENIGAGQTVDMDRLAEVVVENARKTAQQFTLLDQKPISNSRGYGRLVHTKARMAGIDLEFYYGLYAREPQIYQVIAWTDTKKFAINESQLREWVSSLETF